jgi:hypothetical protein
VSLYISFIQTFYTFRKIFNGSVGIIFDTAGAYVSQEISIHLEPYSLKIDFNQKKKFFYVYTHNLQLIQRTHL